MFVVAVHVVGVYLHEEVHLDLVVQRRVLLRVIALLGASRLAFRDQKFDVLEEQISAVELEAGLLILRFLELLGLDQLAIDDAGVLLLVDGEDVLPQF